MRIANSLMPAHQYNTWSNHACAIWPARERIMAAYSSSHADSRPDSRPDTRPDSEDCPLIKKPSTKSVVWNYFGLQADECSKVLTEREDKPVCRSCQKTVLAKGGNTTNLLTHLRDHHPDLYVEAAPSSSRATSRRQPTLQEVVTKGKAYDPKSD